jgi:predicted nucleic acid-binding protein
LTLLAEALGVSPASAKRRDLSTLSGSWSDAETADRYGRLVHQLRRQGMPVPTNDVWIAAVALQLGATLLTRDKHFSVIPMLAIRGWGPAE